MSVKIYDRGHRLPPTFREVKSTYLNGMLFVPDRGVPIHPESVGRLFDRMHPDHALCFVPEIPVATDLGLPRYEPLLYWLPFPKTLVSRCMLHPREALRKWRHGSAWSPPIPPDCGRLTELGRQEQLHYFVDHVSAVCPTPRQVSVVVSNTCNLKCVMCPYHSPLIRPTHQTDFFKDRLLMKWEVLDRLAWECGEHRIPVKIGNVEEPLQHPRLVDFIRACRTRGVPWLHLTTNGVTMTEQVSAQLLEAGLSSLYVSLDASRPETYRLVRGSNLEKVEANVRTFLRLRRERGVPCSVMVSFVKNKEVSQEEIAEFRRRWLPELDGVIFYNLAEYETGSSRFAVINPVAKNLMDQVGGRWPCLSPWQEAYVLPDGRVYYCCETVSKLAFDNLTSMGSYPQQSLTELWNGPLFSQLRRDLILNRLEGWPACKECGIWMADATSSEIQNGTRITTNMITEIIQPQQT